jgi:hypothetical protein
MVVTVPVLRSKEHHEFRFLEISQGNPALVSGDSMHQQCTARSQKSEAGKGENLSNQS